MSMMQCNVITY